MTSSVGIMTGCQILLNEKKDNKPIVFEPEHEQRAEQVCVFVTAFGAAKR